MRGPSKAEQIIKSKSHTGSFDSYSNIVGRTRHTVVRSILPTFERNRHQGNVIGLQFIVGKVVD